MPTKAIWVLKNEGPLMFGKKTVKKTANIIGIKRRAKFSENYNYLANPLFQITEKDLSDSKAASKRSITEVKKI